MANSVRIKLSLPLPSEKQWEHWPIAICSTTRLTCGFISSMGSVYAV